MVEVRGWSGRGAHGAENAARWRVEDYVGLGRGAADVPCVRWLPGEHNEVQGWGLT